MSPSTTLASALLPCDAPRVVTNAGPLYGIVHTNKAWCDATGYSFLEVAGKPLLTLLAGPESGAPALQKLHTALAARKSCSTTLINYRRDGAPFYNHVSCELVRGGSHWVATAFVQPISEGDLHSQQRQEELRAPTPPPMHPMSYADVARERPAKRARRMDRARLVDVLNNTSEPIVLCAAEAPHVITHPNQAWLEMCGYSLEEVEGLTNKILTGPETDPRAVEDLLACVRRREPSVQTLVNYKKGGVRFVNQVVTLPVYDEQDELAAFMSMLHEIDDDTPPQPPPPASSSASSHGSSNPADGATSASEPPSAQAQLRQPPSPHHPHPLNPGVAHLWAALQLKFEADSAHLRASATDGPAREEASRVLLTNFMAVLADMTAPLASVSSQPSLSRVPTGVRAYADQALRETCRRLLCRPHDTTTTTTTDAPSSASARAAAGGGRGAVGGGRGALVSERLGDTHPALPAQQRAWAQAVAFLDRRIQTQPHSSGRGADMSEEAATAMRAVLRQIGREAEACA